MKSKISDISLYLNVLYGIQLYYLPFLVSDRNASGTTCRVRRWDHSGRTVLGMPHSNSELKVTKTFMSLRLCI